MKITHLLSSFAVLLAASCATTGGKVDPSMSDSTPREKRIEAPMSMVEGPSITPSAPLLSFLAGTEKQRKRVRLPVVVRFSDAAHSGVAKAFVGVSEASLGADPLELALNDTAMGIALLDHLRRQCPKEALTCSAWLEGNWGTTFPPGETQQGPAHPFSVVRFHETIDPAAPSELLHAMVEP